MAGVSALDGIVREDLAGERVLVAHVHRAEPLTKSDPPQVASIIIREPLPPEHHEHTVEEAYVRFRDDAERIHAALSHALPGGTLDALFALLAAERASAYVVPGQWHDGARNLRALVEQTRELVDLFAGEQTRPAVRTCPTCQHLTEVHDDDGTCVTCVSAHADGTRIDGPCQ